MALQPGSPALRSPKKRAHNSARGFETVRRSSRNISSYISARVRATVTKFLAQLAASIGNTTANSSGLYWQQRAGDSKLK